jgi:hypothetical protein
MKKTILAASGILFSLLANAGTNGVTELQKEKEALVGKSVLSNGFYLNLGIAFPSATTTPTKLEISGTGSGDGVYTSNIPSALTPQLSFGPQFNIEIGNQWYFWKNEKMGIGLRVSWLQFGIGGLTSKFSGSSNEATGTNIDVRLIKIAPQFTYAFNPKMALDISFEIAPTLFVGAGTYTPTTGGTQTSLFYAAPGLLFAPGVKFRYSVFAVGVDLGFGTPVIAQAYTTGSTVITLTGNTSIFMPRIYIGFKF